MTQDNSSLVPRGDSKFLELAQPTNVQNINVRKGQALKSKQKMFLFIQNPVAH